MRAYGTLWTRAALQEAVSSKVYRLIQRVTTILRRTSADPLV